jgi:glycine betaine/proline transport system substrate-binding protein
MGIREVGRLAVVTALAACIHCGTAAPPAPPPSTVKLVANPWDASRLDVAIASSLLATEMGMQVEVTEIDEYSQWPLFASGAEDACLEVWPSGHAADIAEYIDPGKVEDLGPLGPTGQISWYVPTYLLTSNAALDTWQSYADPSQASPFATTMTGTKGQFTSGDPTWVSYDADIIRNLGLDLEVVYLGSEAAELAALDVAYAGREPFLFYLWSPHPALAEYELTPVQLPSYTAACYAKATDGGVDCAYPPDPLFKIARIGLQRANPRAYVFLQRMSLTTQDQIALLDLVDGEGYSIATAAAQWIAQNKRIWSSWIPAKD